MKNITKNIFLSDYSYCGNTHFLIIKGISIFIIVLVHLCNRYLNIGLLSPFAGAAVAVFLLCSGYGLSESFLRKEGLPHYWENKIIKIWLPSFLKLGLIALITGIGVYAWVTEYPLFLYGWYLQVLFGEYFVFWLLYRFIKNNTLRLVALFGASVIAFGLIQSQLYAEQLFCFPLGVLFSQMKWGEKTKAWDIKKRILFVGMCVAVCAGAFLLRKKFSHYILSNLVWLLFKVSLAFLICFVPYYLRKMRFWGIFIPLGVYSYALYLFNNHVLALLKFGTQWYMIAGDLLLMMVVAIVFQFLCDKLADFYYKVIKKNKGRV